MGGSDNQHTPQLTIICPVFQEENTIPLFYERIRKIFKEISGRYEPNLLFVDNDSQDNTQQIVRELCEKDPRVFCIVQSCNGGHQRSLECGLKNAHGDLFAIIDVDCEDPPEMLLDFLREYENGNDIVYGERVDRDEFFPIKLTRKLFYRITKTVADEHFILDMAEFSLITSEVRDAIIRDNNSFPFIRASIGRVGFKNKGLPYKRKKRVAGETHYNFWEMTTYAIGGILSSSTFLLRGQMYVFPFWLLTMISLGLAQINLPQYSLIPLIIILGFAYCGFSATMVSIYIARMYKNTLNRPNFFINKNKSLLQPER